MAPMHTRNEKRIHTHTQAHLFSDGFESRQQPLQPAPATQALNKY